METWGLDRRGAYTDFTKSLTGQSFLPSSPHAWHLPIAAAHFSFGNHSLSHSYSSDEGDPIYKPDLGPSTYSAFWPLRLFQGWTCNPSQVKEDNAPRLCLLENSCFLPKLELLRYKLEVGVVVFLLLPETWLRKIPTQKKADAELRESQWLITVHEQLHQTMPGNPTPPLVFSLCRSTIFLLLWQAQVHSFHVIQKVENIYFSQKTSLY